MRQKTLSDGYQFMVTLFVCLGVDMNATDELGLSGRRVLVLGI
jgi:hypothetical protein